MGAGRMALGLVAAAATGAILGMLFAPSKGKVLRRKIRSIAAKEMEDIKDKYDEFTENVSKGYEKMKENINDFTRKNMNHHDEKVKTAENN